MFFNGSRFWKRKGEEEPGEFKNLREALSNILSWIKKQVMKFFTDGCDEHEQRES